MTDRLHQIRQKNPELRLAIYAMTPGEPVTLEILTPDDQVFTFTKPTLTEALDAAFPPEPETPAPVELFGEEWP